MNPSRLRPTGLAASSNHRQQFYSHVAAMAFNLTPLQTALLRCFNRQEQPPFRIALDHFLSSAAVTGFSHLCLRTLLCNHSTYRSVPRPSHPQLRWCFAHWILFAESTSMLPFVSQTRCPFSGICKIIPPPGYLRTFALDEEFEFTVRQQKLREHHWEDFGPNDLLFDLDRYRNIYLMDSHNLWQNAMEHMTNRSMCERHNSTWSRICNASGHRKLQIWHVYRFEIWLKMVDFGRFLSYLSYFIDLI